MFHRHLAVSALAIGALIAFGPPAQAADPDSPPPTPTPTIETGQADAVDPRDAIANLGEDFFDLLAETLGPLLTPTPVPVPTPIAEPTPPAGDRKLPWPWTDRTETQPADAVEVAPPTPQPTLTPIPARTPTPLPRQTSVAEPTATPAPPATATPTDAPTAEPAVIERSALQASSAALEPEIAAGPQRTGGHRWLQTAVLIGLALITAAFLFAVLSRLRTAQPDRVGAALRTSVPRRLRRRPTPIATVEATVEGTEPEIDVGRASEVAAAAFEIASAALPDSIIPLAIAVAQDSVTVALSGSARGTALAEIADGDQLGTRWRLGMDAVVAQVREAPAGSLGLIEVSRSTVEQRLFINLIGGERVSIEGPPVLQSALLASLRDRVQSEANLAVFDLLADTAPPPPNVPVVIVAGPSVIDTDLARLPELANNACVVGLLSSQPLADGLRLRIPTADFGMLQPFALPFIPAIDPSAATVPTHTDLTSPTAPPQPSPSVAAAVQPPDPPRNGKAPRQAALSVPAEPAQTKPDAATETVPDEHTPDPEGEPQPAQNTDDAATRVAEIMAPRPIEVRVLGERAEIDGVGLAAHHKTGALFTYLAFHREVPIERTLDLFFESRGALDTSIGSIRQRLDAAGEPGRLKTIRQRRTYRISDDIATDWGRVEQLVAAAADATDSAEELRYTNAVVDLIDGAPLRSMDNNGQHYEWFCDDPVLYHHVTASLVAAARRCGELHLVAGNPDAARTALEAALGVDNTDAESWCVLLRVAASGGSAEKVNRVATDARKTLAAVGSEDEVDGRITDVHEELIEALTKMSDNSAD